MLTRKYIQKQVAAYQQLMGLDNWDIQVKFSVSTEDHFAECGADSEYESAVLYFNLDKSKDKRDVKKTIIHELLHVQFSVLLQPMNKVLNKKQRKLLNVLEHFVITKVEKWPLWKEL